jgi:hypothetical protein
MKPLKAWNWFLIFGLYVTLCIIGSAFLAQHTHWVK